MEDRVSKGKELEISVGGPVWLGRGPGKGLGKQGFTHQEGPDSENFTY